MNKKLNQLLFCLSLTIAFVGASSIIKAQNIPENNHTNDRWQKVFQDSFNQQDFRSNILQHFCSTSKGNRQ